MVCLYMTCLRDHWSYFFFQFHQPITFLEKKDVLFSLEKKLCRSAAASLAIHLSHFWVLLFFNSIPSLGGSHQASFKAKQLFMLSATWHESMSLAHSASGGQCGAGTNRSLQNWLAHFNHTTTAARSLNKEAWGTKRGLVHAQWAQERCDIKSNANC